MELITSKKVHLTQLVAGDRFRFINGTAVFKVIEQHGIYVKIGSRHTEKTWQISTEKIVIKFPDSL